MVKATVDARLKSVVLYSEGVKTARNRQSLQHLGQGAEDMVVYRNKKYFNKNRAIIKKRTEIHATN